MSSYPPCFPPVRGCAAATNGSIKTSRFNHDAVRDIPREQEVIGTGAPGSIAAGIAQDAAQVGQQQTRRTMNTSPTIRVPRGYRLTLILGKDLWVKPLKS
jgi:type IV secretory pathway VirB10-like protein